MSETRRCEADERRLPSSRPGSRGSRVPAVVRAGEWVYTVSSVAVNFITLALVHHRTRPVHKSVMRGSESRSSSGELCRSLLGGLSGRDTRAAIVNNVKCGRLDGQLSPLGRDRGANRKCGTHA